MRGTVQPVSVCVVEDDDAVRDSLAALLEPEGFAISLYPSADEFLKNLKIDSPGTAGTDCLLLDLNMPNRGGLDLLAVLADRECGIPVVVMTGALDEITRTRARDKGAVAFLEKPFEADQLIDAVNFACRNRTRREV